MRWCMRHCSKVYAWCKQVPFIWLIFCGQMYEPSKRKSGCNYRKSSELQPVIKIQLFRKLFLYCSLRRSQTSDRHAEWRTTYVVQTNFMAELNRRWFTSMFTTDATFQIWAY